MGKTKITKQEIEKRGLKELTKGHYELSDQFWGVGIEQDYDSDVWTVDVHGEYVVLVMKYTDELDKFLELLEISKKYE